MVSLSAVEDINANVVQRHLVAVFFGGTSGIGELTLRALANTCAKHNGKGFRAYIVGRRPESAAKIAADCKAVFPSAEVDFVKVDDLALIRSVNEACKEVIRKEEARGKDARIDYLMLSQGGAIFCPRRDTPEGLDKTMALMYYSRMRAILLLQPLLVKSSHSTVVSVYASSAEDKLFEDDLSLRAPGRYNYNLARSHMVYMHTLFMETLAEKYADKMSLIHIFPGLVITPAFKTPDPDLPTWTRLLLKYFFLPFIAPWVSLPLEECGKRMVSLKGEQLADVVATNGVKGGGCYGLTWNGESNFKDDKYKKIDKDEVKKRVWKHTNDAFDVITSGQAFKD